MEKKERKNKGQGAGEKKQKNSHHRHLVFSRRHREEGCSYLWRAAGGAARAQRVWLEGDPCKVITLPGSDPLGCVIYRHGAGCHGCRIGANCHSTGLLRTLSEHACACARVCVCVFTPFFCPSSFTVCSLRFVHTRPCVYPCVCVCVFV